MQPAKPTAPNVKLGQSRWKGYGGPALPSPTLAQCLNGGLGWLEVECRACKTRASLPLDAIRRPRGTPIWKVGAEVPIMSDASLFASGSDDQAHRTARACAVSFGASGRREVRRRVHAWRPHGQSAIRAPGA